MNIEICKKCRKNIYVDYYSDYYLSFDCFIFYCNEDIEFDIFDFFLKLPENLYDSFKKEFAEDFKEGFPIKLEKEKICSFLKEVKNHKCPFKFEQEIAD